MRPGPRKRAGPPADYTPLVVVVVVLLLGLIALDSLGMGSIAVESKEIWVSRTPSIEVLAVVGLAVVVAGLVFATLQIVRG